MQVFKKYIFFVKLYIFLIYRQNIVKYLHYIHCSLTFFFEGGKFDICQLIRLLLVHCL